MAVPWLCCTTRVGVGVPLTLDGFSLGGSDLDFCDLAIEVRGNKGLTEQFHTSIPCPAVVCLQTMRGSFRRDFGGGNLCTTLFRTRSQNDFAYLEGRTLLE
jgi:hypothetical protein